MCREPYAVPQLCLVFRVPCALRRVPFSIPLHREPLTVSVNCIDLTRCFPSIPSYQQRNNVPLGPHHRKAFARELGTFDLDLTLEELKELRNAD